MIYYALKNINAQSLTHKSGEQKWHCILMTQCTERAEVIQYLSPQCDLIWHQSQHKEI